MYDIIIKNGTVVDGSGKPMYKADIGIKENKIAKIGFIITKRCQLLIDASKQYIAPGFIDIHNHSDNFWTLFTQPGLDSLLRQGITTIIGGNCGDSLAPLVNPQILEQIQKWAEIQDVQSNWTSVEEYLNYLEKNKIIVNYGTLIGHNTLRQGILGNQIREASIEEITAMQNILQKAIEQGGFGLSSGLAFAPANTTSTDQLIELARIAGQEGALYVTHLRSESVEVVKAVKEAIDIAGRTNASLLISHLKVKEERNWDKMDEVLRLIEYAKRDDISAHFDIYPYTAAGSVLGIYLPDWLFERGQKGLLEVLKDPEIKARVVYEMQDTNHDFSKMWISICPKCPQFVGKKVEEIAASMDISNEQAIVEIILASENHALCYNEVISEENIIKALKSPFSIIASGGPGYQRDSISQSGSLIHPRSFGTFPRVFSKYVRHQKVLTWEQAIHKMTGLPSEKFQLKKRGLLKKGYFADLVVFDPKEIRDEATFENPFRHAWGIKNLIINGQPTIIDEEIIPNVHPGKVLRY